MSLSKIKSSVSSNENENSINSNQDDNGSINFTWEYLIWLKPQSGTYENYIFIHTNAYINQCMSI